MVKGREAQKGPERGRTNCERPPGNPANRAARRPVGRGSSSHGAAPLPLPAALSPASHRLRDGGLLGDRDSCFPPGRRSTLPHFVLNTRLCRSARGQLPAGALHLQPHSLFPEGAAAHGGGGGGSGYQPLLGFPARWTVGLLRSEGPRGQLLPLKVHFVPRLAWAQGPRKGPAPLCGRVSPGGSPGVHSSSPAAAGFFTQSATAGTPQRMSECLCMNGASGCA